jgi:hypothetical protein
MIESELFGYEDGAFTGARKKGAIGALRSATSVPGARGGKRGENGAALCCTGSVGRPGVLF